MKRWWIKTIVPCLVASVAVFSYFEHATPPLKEEILVEHLFRNLFLESAPYVLCGDKPMSMSYYFQFDPFDGYHLKPLHEVAASVAETYHPYNRLTKESLCLWNKKFAHRPSNFIIKTYPGKRSAEILLINKANFIKTVQQYESVFRERLSTFSDPENFCQGYFSSHSSIMDVLKEDQLLLGILLGYGKHNAELYDKRERLRQELETIPTDDPLYTEFQNEFYAIANRLHHFPPDTEEFTLNTSSFLLSEEEVERLEFNQWVQFCPLPEFAADLSSEETEALRQSYEKTREKVRALYKDRPFLEQTLSQFFPNEAHEHNSTH